MSNEKRKIMKESAEQTRDKIDLAEKAALNKRLTALEKEVADLQASMAAGFVSPKQLAEIRKRVLMEIRNSQVSDQNFS
jgi:ribosomal protein L29